jgi:hypothetical protein
MRPIILLILCCSPALAIYKGEEEKGHSGFSRYAVYSEIDKKQYCTGVLLAPDIILTTAWCVMLSKQQTWFYHSKAGAKVELKPIHSRINPDFDPSKLTWGVKNTGLLRLQKPVGDAFGDFYKTITYTPINKDETVVIGAYGRVENENQSSAGVYRAASLKVDKDIVPFLQNGQLVNAPVIDNTQPVASACSGDWGGGVFKKRGDKDTLVGMMVGNVPPKDTLAGSCGGQTLMVHLGFVIDWLDKGILELRKMDVSK